MQDIPADVKALKQVQNSRWQESWQAGAGSWLVRQARDSFRWAAEVQNCELNQSQSQTGVSVERTEKIPKQQAECGSQQQVMRNQQSPKQARQTQKHVQDQVTDGRI